MESGFPFERAFPVPCLIRTRGEASVSRMGTRSSVNSTQKKRTAIDDSRMSFRSLWRNPSTTIQN